eukprot:CCRYP_000173-RA/>CCRYP_000173-RA protein AED:0.28 eAED:0.30 QI:0/0/0/1/0/0/2/0/175
MDFSLVLMITRYLSSSRNSESRVLTLKTDYVGFHITKASDGTYECTQGALKNTVIDHIKIDDSYTKPILAKVTLQLHAFYDSPKFQRNLNYCSVVGHLNYLDQTTQPDVIYTAHKVAKYSTNPRQGNNLYIILDFASSLTLPKASNATVTQILQAIETRSLQKVTLSLWSLGVAG